MKFDDIFLHIGEFGSYQKRIFYLLCLLPLLGGRAQLYSYLFTNSMQDHRCRLPGYPHDTYDVQNEAHAQAVNHSIPPGDDVTGSFSSCEIYSDVNATWNCTFDVVCDRTILRSHGYMTLFAGGLFGSIIMATVSDTFGRKKTLLMSIVMWLVAQLGSYFATSFEFLIAVKAVDGMTVYSIYTTCAVLGIELVGPNKRSFVGVVLELSWSVGVILTVPLVYLVRHWRTVHLLLGLTIVLPLFATLCYIPESVRWLLGKGRTGQAKKIIQKVCQANGTKLPPHAFDEDTLEEEEPQLKIWTIFSHRVLVFRYSILFFSWFATNLVYYGLTFRTSNLGGHLFVNCFLTSASEIVASLIALPLLWRIGRRTLFCSSLLASSFCCLASIFAIMFVLPDWLNVGLNTIGKSTMTVCYTTLYIFTTELFPTKLRNGGLSVCMFFDSIGGMFSSYVADLDLLVGGKIGPLLPVIVFSGVSFISGFLSMLLPETHHRILPETLRDVIELNDPQCNPLYVKANQIEMEVSPPPPPQPSSSPSTNKSASDNSNLNDHLLSQNNGVVKD